ncbi:MAG: hypothetical protein CMC93_05600 [Flavobacteriaceae bacterium]|nr:hypothetical protein [Flavobacteriaceae bacterium]
MFQYIVFIIFILSLILYPIAFFTHDYEKPMSGLVETTLNIDDYGFGPDKRLLIFDLTEIGDVQNIDMSDKKYARLQWSSLSHGTRDRDIGIEIKGSGFNQRKKINLAFEFWECEDDEEEQKLPPENEPPQGPGGFLPPDEELVPEPKFGMPARSCDDDKDEMFDFGEDYEDYVLRGGWHEQTFVRDVVASELEGGILQKDLVEVLIKIGDKYTYEGVYILIPAIQRRVLEKRLDWDEKGKKEDCDDEDYDIEVVSLIIEHTIESNGRKEPCEIFKDYSVKMRYPKCDFYDEPQIAPCRKEYMDRTNHFASVLNLKNETPVALDLESFANNYLAEMLMREDDFPFTSQYFYVDPDDSILHAGPRWDYDLAYWRVSDKKSWDLVDLGYYSQGSIKLWKELGKNEEFINLVKTKKDTVIQNNQTVYDLIQTRKQQFEDGLFDRELERWGMFGKKRDSPYIMYLAFNAYSKNSPKSELNDMEDYFITRSKWMSENIESFDGYSTRHHQAWAMLILITVPLWLSFLVGLCLLIQNKNNGYMVVPDN